MVRLTGLRYWYNDGSGWESEAITVEYAETEDTEFYAFFNQEKIDEGFFGQAVVPPRWKTIPWKVHGRGFG